MKKALLLSLLFALFTSLGFSQAGKYWSVNSEDRGKITKYKAVSRLSFPKEFRLFNLDIAPLKQVLFSVVDNSAQHSTIITLPNAEGNFEQFEVFEASNFEPALQARFPQIRAFSGKGITDRSATLKISLSPQGIQTMVFRTEKENEFIEAYSQDRTVYAVFNSYRTPGQLPWTCSTEDKQTANELSTQIANSGRLLSNTGELKTMRLAQSCNAEYSIYFGATSAADVALVLAAFNATLTRCNGCYEKDLAVHLNLIANTDQVIYYNPATDPYTGMGSWNAQLQTTLTNVIGAANYDIGHMFGASGGGGNAGCIGCVCGAQKGSGITSPADGIPEGDNFDIDYVVHEVGHQMGANHTFSMSVEGSGVNKEVGSGITIMGYAGITPYDVAPHSIDIFHEASIQQIQVNLATKTCPITTSLAGTNATPVITPHADYTIPISTPFALTGVATDADAADVLTYCWEQNDNATSQTNANSKASPTKTGGPNWLSFSPTTSPTRFCPKLSTILAGGFTTGPLPGGDAGMTIEALSSVNRTLNFRLTVRDNSPYSSTAPIKVGQTSFDDVVLTVTNTSGPFMVTQPNTNLSWQAGTTQNITWDVANTTTAPVSCANVKISLSTDGGLTWPIVLAANTPNDGTEALVIPNNVTTTARIVVESVGNIFFDISNTNFTITAAATGFSFNSVAPATVACGGAATSAISLATTSNGGFSTPIVMSASGAPLGTSVSFSPTTIAPGSTTTVTLTGVNTLTPGSYDITVTGTAGSVVQTTTLTYTVQPGTPPAITTQPSSVTVCSGANATFTTAATGTGLTYQWQVNQGAGFSNIAGATAASYTATSVTGTMNNYQYQAIVTALCGVATTNAATLTINSATAINTQPVAAAVCAGTDNTFSVQAAGTGLTYQWQSSPTGCGGTFTNIAGATSSSYTLTNIALSQDGSAYQVIVSGTCAPATITSTCVPLTVTGSVNITSQPSNVTACSGTDAVFTVAGSGSGLSYQWQVNQGAGFSNIAGATSATLTLPAVTVAMSGYQYQAVLSNAACASPATSNAVSLTVNETPAVTADPSDVATCPGSNAVFTSTAVGTGITYQWQVNPGTGFTDIPGATSASLTVPSVVAAQNNYEYQVVVSGTCTPAATSSAATLTVLEPAAISAQPTNVTECNGAAATFSANASGSGLTYQWQVNPGTGFTDIPGATAATLTIPAVTDAMNNSSYQVVVTGTCSSATSDVVTLTVNPLPSVSITAAPYNNVAPTTTTTLTAASTPAASSYSWYLNGTLVPSATTNTITVAHADTGNYYVSVVDINGCTNRSNTLHIGDSVLSYTFIYPNPNFGHFWVRHQGVQYNSKPRFITLYDGKGAKVYQKSFVTSVPYEPMEVVAEYLGKGTYALTLSDNEGKIIATGKVVVQ